MTTTQRKLKEKVLKLYEHGIAPKDIAAKLECAVGTVSYHIRRFEDEDQKTHATVAQVAQAAPKLEPQAELLPVPSPQMHDSLEEAYASFLELKNKMLRMAAMEMLSKLQPQDQRKYRMILNQC